MIIMIFILRIMNYSRKKCEEAMLNLSKAVILVSMGIVKVLFHVLGLDIFGKICS